MVPLVATKLEFDLVRARIVAVAEEVQRERTGRRVPRRHHDRASARCAAGRRKSLKPRNFSRSAPTTLTQTTFGISRDDSARFLGDYAAKGILAIDPFVSLDVDGVGELVKIAVARGRARRRNIKLGICGEHGGDPASILFCEEAGLDYVSCSPFRVPIARLAAAQAAARADRK